MSAERFRFQVGDNVNIGGEVEWGDGGWLVTNADNRFQAPNEMDKHEAVLTWLRQVLVAADGEPLDGRNDAEA